MDFLGIKKVVFGVLKFILFTITLFVIASCNKETLVEGRISSQVKGSLDLVFTSNEFNSFRQTSRSFSIEGVSLIAATGFGKRLFVSDSIASIGISITSSGNPGFGFFIRENNGNLAARYNSGAVVPWTFLTTTSGSVEFVKPRGQTSWSNRIPGTFYYALRFQNSKREDVYGWLKITSTNLEVRFGEYFFQTINPPVVP